MKRRTTLLAGVCTLATVGAAAIFCLAGSKPSDGLGQAPAAARPHADASRLPPTLFAPRPLPRAGEREKREISMHVGFESSGKSAGEGDGANMRLGLKGTWIVDVARVTASEVELSTRLTEVSLDGPAGQAAPDFLQSLEMPAQVLMDVRGRIRDIRIPEAADPFARSLVQQLIAAHQFVNPENATPSWEASELHPSGELAARYVATGERRVRKSFTRVLRSNVGGSIGSGTDLSPIPILSEFSFAFDEGASASGVSGRVVMALSIAEPDVQMRTSVELDSRLVGRSHSPATIETPKQPLLSWEQSSKRLLEAASVDSERNAFKGENVRSLLAKLPAKGRAERGVGQLAFQLGMLLRHESAAIADVVQALREGRVDQSALGSLAQAGTPETQKALMDIAQDSGADETLRLRSIESTVAIEEPTAATTATLAALADSESDEIARSARYAQGATAARLAASAPDRAAEIVQTLLAALARAQTDDEKIKILEALGNTGHRGALPALQSACLAPQAEIRAAAVFALRSIEDEDADVTISNLLGKDPAAKVREQAARAGQERRFEDVGVALLEAVRRDKAPTVRREAVQALAVFHERDRAIEATRALEWAAQSAPEEELREAATRALRGS